MARVNAYVRRDSDGTLAHVVREEGPTASLAKVQARLPAGHTALDAASSPRPPDPPQPADRLAAARTKWQAAEADAVNRETLEREALAIALGVKGP